MIPDTFALLYLNALFLEVDVEYYHVAREEYFLVVLFDHFKPLLWVILFSDLGFLFDVDSLFSFIKDSTSLCVFCVSQYAFYLVTFPIVHCFL